MQITFNYCVPVTKCDKPEINNAQITSGVRRNYNHNEQIQYVCENSEEVLSARCEQGVWTGIKNCSGVDVRLEKNH